MALTQWNVRRPSGVGTVSGFSGLWAWRASNSSKTEGRAPGFKTMRKRPSWARHRRNVGPLQCRESSNRQMARPGKAFLSRAKRRGSALSSQSCLYRSSLFPWRGTFSTNWLPGVFAHRPASRPALRPAARPADGQKHYREGQPRAGDPFGLHDGAVIQGPPVLGGLRQAALGER